MLFKTVMESHPTIHYYDRVSLTLLCDEFSRKLIKVRGILNFPRFNLFKPNQI